MALTYIYKRTGSTCVVEEGSVAHKRILGEDAAKYQLVKPTKADKPAKEKPAKEKPADDGSAPVTEAPSAE